MDPRTRPAAPRRYEIFDPKLDAVAEQGAVTLLVHLPDFRKEELRVQVSPPGLLRISGECPLGDDKWRRFVKEVRVPEECDSKGIVAKFDGGVLYVKQPKLAIPEKINVPETSMEEKEEPRREGKANDDERAEDLKGTVKDDQRKFVEDEQNGMGSGDAENEDYSRKKKEEEEIIRPDEGSLFEKVKINLRKLLLILVLVVTLFLHIRYAGWVV